MAESKRWSITYTKHIKQKRKVYHDGFLVFDPSTNKAMLYDESDTLLECRILKNDEIVCSGESLAFNSYLVDVGDIEGEGKPLRDLNARGNEEKVVKRFSSGPKMVKSKVHSMGVNPSQKIIRDFKKSEMNKYRATQNDQEGTKPTAMDWHVLYTAQLTQKTKKYHDGFIRCSSSGSMTRQVMLYDSKWTLLESRFMKQGEELKSGERTEFQGYLVEIGECARNHKMGLFVESSPKQGSLQKSKKLKEQNHFKGKGQGLNNVELQQHGMQKKISDSGGSNIIAWQVLYTTQLTQKAKKYQDGFLQLSSRGSLGKQVTLYDENRKVLNNRFLKKDEAIRSGELVAFDGYLVDIGEPEKQEPILAYFYGQEGNDGAIGEAKGLGQLNCVKAEKSVLRGKNRERDHATENMIVSYGIPLVEKMQLNQIDFQQKPLRDVSQILSILQKPVAVEGIDADSFGEGLVTLQSMARGPSESEDPKSDFSAPMLSPKATCIDGNHLLGGVSVSCSTLCNSDGGTFAHGNSSVLRSNIFSQEEKKIADDEDKCPSFDLGF